jgi:BirA family transcriptional regulator, biotin operon repressor / biotin---[acetyl-CoA-carboxylase] ligase
MIDPPAPPAVIRLGAVDSTQNVAWGLVDENIADGTVVTAQSQHDARGRRGRHWHDEPGACLGASVILRPRLAVSALGGLSFAAALAVAEALESEAGLAPRLKWPNDVLVDRRKIAGILLESRATPAPVVVVGFGINLTQRAFPAAIAGRATSVALAGGGPVSADALLDAVVRGLDVWRRRLEGEGFEPLRRRWRALADTLGRRVTIDGVEGLAVDLDADGALLVEREGTVHRVVAGEVTEGVRDAARD